MLQQRNPTFQRACIRRAAAPASLLVNICATSTPGCCCSSCSLPSYARPRLRPPRCRLAWRQLGPLLALAPCALCPAHSALSPLFQPRAGRLPAALPFPWVWLTTAANPRALRRWQHRWRRQRLPQILAATRRTRPRIRTRPSNCKAGGTRPSRRRRRGRLPVVRRAERPSPPLNPWHRR